MKAQELLTEASGLRENLQSIRRDLHAHPELGFDLKYTKDLVKSELMKLGYEQVECGK